MYSPRKRITIAICALAIFLAFSADLWAVSLSPEVVEKLRREGRLQEWVDRGLDARARGVWAPNPNPPVRLAPLGKAQEDTLKPFVLCIDFSDNPATKDTSEFSFLLFSQDFAYPTGSFRDYFTENSYGTLDLDGAVFGWVRAPQTYEYYVAGAYGLGMYPHNCQRMVEDALTIANAYVNFQEFDNDDNGWIDGLLVIHAGPGAEETGSDDDVWSHRWSMSTTKIFDGVYMRQYAMQPEIHPGGALIDIGVFCHEFGHFLGAVDLYDYGYDSEGVGNWSVMASGSWLNGGNTPSHFDAYHKCRILHFSSVVTVESNQTDVEILQAETSPSAYRLWTGAMGGSMYFLVENRQKTGFDSYLPGEGLLIWHVDENAPAPNDYQWCPGDPATPHYRCALEQADGEWELEACPGYSNDGDISDPFPGWLDKRAFDDSTTPSSRDYYDNSTKVAVWNVSDSDSVMYANFDIDWSRPCIVLDDFTVDDLIGGDGDGRPEPGETVRLYFTFTNLWLPSSGTEVTVSADTAGINFTDDYSYLGYMGTGQSQNNNSDPVEFTVDPDFPGRPTIFTLHVEGNGGDYVVEYDQEVWAGRAEILIVDDAGGYQSYYAGALDSLRQIYDIWEAYGKVDPDFSFTAYKYITWYTGDHQTDLFTQAQAESLMSFLDNGGRLFMTSQDAVEVLSGSVEPWAETFLTDYLHLGYNGNNSKYLVVGRAGDAVGDTLYIYPNYEVSNQSSKDNLIPDSESDTVLYYTVGGAGHWWDPSELIAGSKFQNDIFKVVVFGFGFESMRNDGGYFQGQYTSPQKFVMQRVLDWMKLPGPTIYVMSPNGGETWFIGDSADITWESISFDDNVKIEYSTNAGLDWTTIADNTENDGIYTLEVPDTPSESCLVIISDASDGSPADTSDDYFRIVDYVAGDANGDGTVSAGDIVFLISYLYRNGPAPQPMAAGDANNSCEVEAGDIVYLISYLYRNGPPPLPGCA
ncbi:MAG: M6 family metalloprotease domain-containing protein [candidate division Zixibacteria bacterium]|nr:M6 family metalloprotease domain-containing protein [candidate division Zixibacteria bacterium]